MLKKSNQLKLIFSDINIFKYLQHIFIGHINSSIIKKYVLFRGYHYKEKKLILAKGASIKYVRSEGRGVVTPKAYTL